MKRTITVLLAMLLAVGMLASFAGPVVAQDDGDEADTSVCTIEVPEIATESAETVSVNQKVLTTALGF